MRYIIQLFIIGIIAGLCSCESLVTTIPESKLPKGTEKVVLHAYISPQDTVILIKLTLSSPLLGVYRNNGFGYSVVGQDTIYYTGGVVENASVILSDSKNQSVSIPYIKREGIYMLDANRFPIVAGETYTIKAETHKGNIEATCTVPKENNTISSYKIDTLSEEAFGGRIKAFRMYYDWKDIAGQANYYTTKTTLSTTMLLSSMTATWPPQRIPKVIKYYGYWVEENGQQLYQSDASRDGQIISSPRGVVQLNSEVIYDNNERYIATFASEKSIIKLEVLNTDKNYYDYHRAVRINNRQDGNPFVEPVPIPTNVKNGLGCFAASNKSILTVEY